MKVLGEKRGVLVTPHRFRHTHAAERLNEGFTLPEVQRRLGHSRSDATQTYLEVDDEALAASIAAMTPEAREALRALLG